MILQVRRGFYQYLILLIQVGLEKDYNITKSNNNSINLSRRLKKNCSGMILLMQERYFQNLALRTRIGLKTNCITTEKNILLS